MPLDAPTTTATRFFNVSAIVVFQYQWGGVIRADGFLKSHGALPVSLERRR